MKKLITTLFVWNIALTGTIFFLAVENNQTLNLLGQYLQKNEKESKAAVKSLHEMQIKLIEENNLKFTKQSE